MRIQSKVSWLVTATTSLAAVAVATGVLYVNFTAGIEATNSKLNSLIASVSNSNGDTLTYALLAVESQEVSLAYKQYDGQISVLQDSGGPIEARHSLTKSINLGYGEKLIFSVSQETVYQTLYRSIWLSTLVVFLTILLAQAIAWLMLFKDVRMVKNLSNNAKEVAAGKVVLFSNENGSQELNELANSLQVMVAKLQNSKSDMQNFLWDISHELKTPLTVMRGYLDILANQDEIRSEQTMKALDRTQSSVLRMQTLVEDLLLLAELGERNEAKFEPVIVADLLQKWKDDFSALEPERPVEFINNQLTPLSASPELLDQFFTNAFSNVRAHTKSTDELRVSVNQSAAGVQIDIEDAGPGMKKLESGHVVTTFERFDIDHTQKPGSSGLGLSIMDKIVELHGGQLQLSKSDLGGVCVSAFFPQQ